MLNVYFFEYGDTNEVEITSHLTPSIPFRVGDHIELCIENHGLDIWSAENYDELVEIKEIKHRWLKVYPNASGVDYVKSRQDVYVYVTIIPKEV